MVRPQIYACPAHPEVRRVGAGICFKCNRSLVVEASPVAIALHAFEDPFTLIEWVGLVALVMSVMTLIMTSG
jgi:hypothetical protein